MGLLKLPIPAHMKALLVQLIVKVKSLPREFVYVIIAPAPFDKGYEIHTGLSKIEILSNIGIDVLY